MKKKASWPKIKAAYQRGEGSCRILAKRFQVNENTLANRCKREKWRVEKAEMEQKVAEKVVDAMALGAIAWVNSTIERAQRSRAMIDAKIGRKTDSHGIPILHIEDINTMLHAETRADDLARRALGLPDAPQKVEHSGSIDIATKIIEARRRAAKRDPEG